MIDIVYHGIEGKFMTNLEHEKLVETLNEQSRLIDKLIREFNRQSH